MRDAEVTKQLRQSLRVTGFDVSSHFKHLFASRDRASAHAASFISAVIVSHATAIR